MTRQPEAAMLWPSRQSDVLCSDHRRKEHLNIYLVHTLTFLSLSPQRARERERERERDLFLHGKRKKNGRRKRRILKAIVKFKLRIYHCILPPAQH